MAANLNLAELVEKLPLTDKEIEARKAAEKAAQDPTKPPAQPPRDAGASKFTGPEPKLADELCAQVLAGGRARVLELMELIRDPGDPDFKNYKAEYLLHCVVLYAGRPGQETQRRMLSDALTSQVSNDKRSAAVRAFLVRELRLIGDDGAVNALGALLTDEALCDDAAAALLSIGSGAAPQFRAALPKAQGRCRLVVMQSLGVMRDAPSAAAMEKALQDGDRDIRLAAAWGLARMGASGSVPALLKAADVEPVYERTKATQACLLMAETLAATGNRTDAARIYIHLRDTRTDPKEQYLRDLAAKALAGLGG
jgi:HEAT repeat protein